MNRERDRTGKGPKRKLSRFLAREMLYEYVLNALDSSRREAMEDFLKQDPEIQSELDRLKEGLSYCSQLRETRISVPLMQEICDYKGFWERLRKGLLWSSWPGSLKWGTEAVVISAIAVLLGIVTPWKKIFKYLPFGNSDVVLVEVQKNNKAKSNKVTGLLAQEERVSPSVREKVPKGSLKATLKKTKKSKLAQTLKDDSSEASSAPPASVEIAQKPEAKETNKKEDKVTSTSERKPLKGFVYRAFMNLKGLDQKTPKIVQRIKGLGGVKAGQVELGWRKPKGSYFHFSLPESNYEELVKMIRNFGPVRIYKESHWRVMPKSKIRFILWIEEIKKK